MSVKFKCCSNQYFDAHHMMKRRLCSSHDIPNAVQYNTPKLYLIKLNLLKSLVVNLKCYDVQKVGSYLFHDLKKKKT